MFRIDSSHSEAHMLTVFMVLITAMQSHPRMEVVRDRPWGGKEEYRVLADGSFTLRLTKNWEEGYDYSGEGQISVDSIRILIQDLSTIGYFRLSDSLISSRIAEEKRKSGKEWLIYDAPLYQIRIRYRGSYHALHTEGMHTYKEKYPAIKELHTLWSALRRLERFLNILDAAAKHPRLRKTPPKK